MEDKILVVVKEVDKKAEIKEISNDYKEFQERVGGLIDMTPMPGYNDIDIICNDEYLYNGSNANVMMPERDNVLCGNLIFAGFDEEDGSTVSLNANQIKSVMDYIDKNNVQNMDPATAYYLMQSLKKENNFRKEKKEVVAE